VDYAPESTAKKGWEVINTNIEKLEDKTLESSIREKIELIKSGKRDLYY